MRIAPDVPFDISATKITYGDRIVVLAFFRDITQRKQWETQLQQAQKMEAIGTLAGGIAHDFNNILSAIIGHTELAILHKHNSDSAHDHLNQVVSAGKRAAQLVQQILTFSRQKDLERKPLLISPLIQETIKMLRASLPSTIDIQYNVRDQHGLVMADPTHIHQVLMNLCTNAGHAMRGRSGLLQISLDKVTIDGRQSTPLKPGTYKRMSVQDNGHGMDRTTMGCIFDPYFSTKNPNMHGIQQSALQGGGPVPGYPQIPDEAAGHRSTRPHCARGAGPKMKGVSDLIRHIGCIFFLLILGYEYHHQ